MNKNGVKKELKFETNNLNRYFRSKLNSFFRDIKESANSSVDMEKSN